jgi:putative ABC transport system permease protein
MQPPAPPHYRVSLVERLGLKRWLSSQDRMLLRHLGRRPVRAFLSALGIAMACAIVLLGRFSVDALDVVMDVQFEHIHREDLSVTFVEALPAGAARELARLPGVRYAEPFRAVGVTLRHGPRSYDTGITGLPAGADLTRVLDADLRPVALPPAGLVLSDYLAGYLGVGEGDRVTVAVQEGTRPVVTVPVSLVVHEFIGAGAYMERRSLNRLLGEGDLASGAWLAADEAALPALYDALRERPAVLRATALQEARASMEETFSANMLVFTLILTGFAGAIAFGVVYNTARIALEERARELASLRVIGFTRGEVGYLLLGELALLTLAALPLGLVLGTFFCYAYVEGLQTDFFRMPLVLSRASYTFAATLVVAAALLSGLIVWRRIQRLDLIGVLKTRE